MLACNLSATKINNSQRKGKLKNFFLLCEFFLHFQNQADILIVGFLLSNMMTVNYSHAKNHLPSANNIIMEVIKEYAGESFEQIEKAIVRSIREFMERCWGPTADGKRDVEFYQWLKDSKEEEIGGFEYDYVFTGYCDKMIEKLQ